MNRTDHNLFELTKDISYEDILLDCDNISVDDQSNMNDIKFKDMKSRVMKQIKTSKTRGKVITSILAASFILCFLTTALSPFGRNAFAEILNKLYFIPGIGKAVQEDAEDVYILPKPILYECDQGSIIIHTITKTADDMTIYVTSDINMYKESLIIKADNLEYQSSRTMIGHGENNTAMYVFTISSENENYEMELLGKYTIPFVLVKSKSFDHYEEMGPTDIINNVGLTLIPFRLNNKIQFEIIQHNTNQGSVALYGSYNKEMEDNLSIKIQDNNGQTYTADYPKSHMGLQSSYTFTPEKDAASFSVDISEVTLRYDLNNKLKLPMPKEGVTEVNKIIDLQGFKVDVTKIVRKNDKVTVYVDTHYDPNSPENICYFTVDMEKMSLDYYHWIMNDQATTEGFEFYINPKMKNLTIYFNELYTNKKGPWSFHINDLK